jgi:hypothetical protein
MSYGHSGYEQSWPAYPQAGFADAWSYGTRRSAPASVHVVAILQYLGGLLALAGAGLLTLLAVKVRSEPAHPSTDIISPEGASRLFAVAAVFFAVSGIVAIVLGRKLQRGRNWARIVLVVLSAASIVGTLYRSAVLHDDPRYLGGLAIPALYLILLNTRAVRAWCHRAARGPQSRAKTSPVASQLHGRRR